MNIDRLVEQIIPPDGYSSRNGFSNSHIIDGLSESEKTLVEEELLRKLEFKTDILIVETLSYLGSEKAIPILSKILEDSAIPMEKLIIVISIYSINEDAKMAQLAISIAMEMLESNINSTIQAIPILSYLAKLNVPEVYELIEKYSTHTDFLVSYNAKKLLQKVRR